MHNFADIDFGKAAGPALTAMIVPMVLAWLMKSAHSESMANAGDRVVAYPKVFRIFVIIGWVGMGVALFNGFSGKNDEIKNEAAIAGLFIALILPLHLEAFGVMITWDDAFICTRSPWRKARRIPFSAVRSCDYSAAMQWYRIHTEGHGTIRLHQLAKGIPGLLAMLPCPHPGYPPGHHPA